MATISITIPDAVAGRVVDAMAARYGWTQELGITKPQFAKRVLVTLLKDTVKMRESDIAAKAAAQATSEAVESEIDIT